MADNIAVTPGTGATVGAKDVGSGVLQQRVVPTWYDGAAQQDASAAQPMPIQIPGVTTSAPLAIQLPVSTHLVAAPTVTAGAYTTGMVVGGLISLANAARVSGGSGVIQNVNVNVKTALTAPFDVVFFDTQPSNSSFTDNAALAVNTADLPFLCGVAHCTDLVSCGTPQVLQALNVSLPFKLATGTTLYAVIVMRGGETFASTSAIGLSVLALRD